MRLLSEDRARPRLPTTPPPARWQGEDLADRGILVQPEQGVGDEILFASCLPDLIERAGRCVIQCDARLVSLYRHSFPRATVLGSAESPADDMSRARLDYHVPIASLPMYLRGTRAEFPRRESYLAGSVRRVAAWRRRLAGLGEGPWVGLSWRGGTARSRGPARSVPLAMLARALHASGVRWVSLQHDCTEAELAEIRQAHGVLIHRLPEALTDLAETAALMGALDLVITIDNTVAQLAGATGRATWAMLPFVPEWRYGVSGDSMPWYPAARLFRQSAPGAWGPVLEAVARALDAWRDRARPER
ncbi:MAG: hypothetical protein M5U08_17110 [Burkholderiales bacterium]|nr:hypothetical protein [Burkholderiales bacterium]